MVLDNDALAAFNEKIHSAKSELVKNGSSSFTVKVNAEKDCALFTSIPFEEGWTAKIDGKPVEVVSGVNNTLLCVKVPEGEHTIELEYFPAGLKLGVTMTVIGFALLAVMVLAASYLRKKFGDNNSR